MFEAFVISSILILGAVLLLGIRVFFVKDGKFPNTHVGGNKMLREKGIGCATSQDRAAQKNNRDKNSHK